MKAAKFSLLRISTVFAVSLGFMLGGLPPISASAADNGKPPVIEAPISPSKDILSEKKDDTSKPAVDESKFDGKVLYQKAFESVRDSHIMLADEAARKKWIAEWEKKFDGTKQLDTEEGTDKAVEQMLQSLGQRFDYFFDKDATKSEKEEVDATVVGIGVSLKLKDADKLLKALPANATRDDADKALKIGPGNELVITEPTEDGPAEKAGVKANDVITEIDGKKLDGMLMKDAIGLIKGKEKTDVTLTVERTDDKGVKTTHSIKVTRDKIVVKVVHTKDLGNGITYIKLDNFMSQHTMDEMRAALLKAAKGKGVIIDLRGNPGGSLTAVLTVSTYILPEGTLIKTNTRDGDELVEREIIVQRNFLIKNNPDPQDPKSRSIGLAARPTLILPEDMPVVVLVDENSASASEILSGVLQAHKRCIVVGKTTHGKGVGQDVIDLPFGRRLHVTTFEFFPGGKKMDWIGVIPDVEVDQVKGSNKDNQLEEAQKKLKELIDTAAARSKKAEDLEKKNHDEFQKKLDARNNKNKP